MENAFDEITRAIEQARLIERVATNHAVAMADLVLPNLRKLAPRQLERMKRELANYNIATGRWKKS